jgi:hypothetical protein
MYFHIMIFFSSIKQIELFHFHHLFIILEGK